MFNKDGIKLQKGGAPTLILLHTTPYAALGCRVSDTGAVTVGGKKYVLAGTPINGDLDNRLTPFTVAETAEGKSNANAVLVNDVDVTDGPANGSALVFGFVNTNRVDDTVKAMITDEVKAALDAKVTFVAE